VGWESENAIDRNIPAHAHTHTNNTSVPQGCHIAKAAVSAANPKGRGLGRCEWYHTPYTLERKCVGQRLIQKGTF
jgi:hypothetical protein